MVFFRMRSISTRYCDTTMRLLSTRSRYHFLAFILLALVGFQPTHLVAQVSGATLSGTITDNTGAVIPGASLSITRTATGTVAKVKTNSTGFYTVPNLTAGLYEVDVEVPGFSTELRKNLQLAVGASIALNFSMHPGQVVQTVDVSTDLPMVELATSTISHVVESTTVRELPLNGRDWTQLAAIQPGVTVVQSQQSAAAAGSPRANRGFGNQMTVSGARPQQNNYRLDGISINDYSNGGPGSVLGVNLGVDAIQEFSVITSNYDASYGRASGGIINAITRSGTNKFHGSAYEFLRDSALDTSSYFDIVKPSFVRNQFGGALGGPIRKDKTFFFADYEGINQHQGLATVDTVPSANARQGNLSTGQVTVDPQVAPFLGFYPLPNGRLLGSGDTGVYNFSANVISSENFGTARVDQQLTGKDLLSATVLVDEGKTSQPDALDTTLIDSNTLREALVVQENHTFSSALVNAARFGINRQKVVGNENPVAILPLAANTSLGFVPGRAAGFIIVPGLTTYTGGVGSANHPHFAFNSFQFYDDAFWTLGANTIKFGGSVERMQLNELYSSRPNGQFGFGSLKAFLTNHPTNAKADLPVSDTEFGMRQTLFGLYLNDDVRLRPNLTVNLGVRYEPATVPAEVHGKLANLPSPTAAAPHIGNPYYQNPTLKDISPRVGFSWDPFHDGKTSVRGGFGLYDDLPLLYLYELSVPLAAPFFQGVSTTTFATGAFPSAWYNDVAASPKNERTVYIPQDPPRSYVMQYTLNTQREITRNMTFMIGYIGTRGVHMPFRTDDINEVMPTLTPQGYKWPSPKGSGTKLNTNVGQITPILWTSGTSYNGLQSQFTSQLSHGLQFQGSYTWSKCLDDGSASLVSDAFSNSPTGLPWFDSRLRKGVCDFNTPQNFVGSGLWTLPGYHGRNSLLKRTAGGWQFGGIFTAQSGSPFTVTLGGDVLGQKSTAPYDVPNRVSAPGCGSLVNNGNIKSYIKLQCLAFPSDPTLLGNLQRNSLIGPRDLDFDLSLVKDTHITDTVNLQLRFESFNALNHPNFAPPLDNSVAFGQTGTPTPGAGLIDTVNPGREIQVAAKLIF